MSLPPFLGFSILISKASIYTKKKKKHPEWQLGTRMCWPLLSEHTAAKESGIFIYSFISVRATWLSRWGICVLLKGTLKGFKPRCVVMGQSFQPLVCPAASSLAAFKWKSLFRHTEEPFPFPTPEHKSRRCKSRKVSVLAVNRSRHNLHCIFWQNIILHAQTAIASFISKLILLQRVHSVHLGWRGGGLQYSRGQSGRGEDKLWRCFGGERMSAGTQRGRRGRRTESREWLRRADRWIEVTEGQMNMQSGPRVLVLLPSDSTNHPQMVREGEGERGQEGEENNMENGVRMRAGSAQDKDWELFVELCDASAEMIRGSQCQ